MTSPQDALKRVREELLALSVIRPGKSISEAPSEATQKALTALAELESYMRELERENARLTGPFIARDQLPALFENMKTRAERAEVEVRRLREALKAITQTDWHSEGHSKETPFQFEQRVHKIAAYVLRVASGTADSSEEETD